MALHLAEEVSFRILRFFDSQSRERATMSSI
jgi:hypothetical protein